MRIVVLAIAIGLLSSCMSVDTLYPTRTEYRDSGIRTGIDSFDGSKVTSVTLAMHSKAPPMERSIRFQVSGKEPSYKMLAHFYGPAFGLQKVAINIDGAIASVENFSSNQTAMPHGYVEEFDSMDIKKSLVDSIYKAKSVKIRFYGTTVISDAMIDEMNKMMFNRFYEEKIK